MRQDGAFLSLASLLIVLNSEGKRLRSGEDRSSNLVGLEMGMLDGQNSGMLGALSASSCYLLDLQTPDEHADSMKEEVMVDDRFQYE